MFYTYTARFDVMRNFVKFWKLNKALAGIMQGDASLRHRDFTRTRHASVPLSSTPHMETDPLLKQSAHAHRD